MSDATRRPSELHPHVHDRFCGHAAAPHEDHVDFLHDGEIHHVRSDAIAGGRPASADQRPSWAGLHLSHVGHMHVHRPGCGHPAIAHDDHEDYLHGDHRHAGHDVHYDEH